MCFYMFLCVFMILKRISVGFDVLHKNYCFTTLYLLKFNRSLSKKKKLWKSDQPFVLSSEVIEVRRKTFYVCPVSLRRPYPLTSKEESDIVQCFRLRVKKKCPLRF